MRSPAFVGFLLVATLLLTLIVIVWRDALGYYFSQDDFLGLARARGLTPRFTAPIRYLSNQGLWDLLRPLGVASARPYHLLSLAAHAASTITLYGLLARRYSLAAAFLGAAFFATHPALFTALHWVSAIGDPLALLFALLALQAALGTRWRFTAWPLFGLSLMCKESCLMLPLVVMAHRWWGARSDRHAALVGSGGHTLRHRLADPVLAGLWLIAAIALVNLGSRVYGTEVRRAISSGLGTAIDPYALGDLGSLAANALTYMGWTANLWFPTVRGFSDGVDRSVWPWAFALFVMWGLGACLEPLRRRGWTAAAITFAAFLMPVLPLRNHTYHYYLDAPLVGIAWGLALAGDAALAWMRGLDRRLAWVVAGALAVVLTVNGLRLAVWIANAPLTAELRADPIVDRARIADNVFESLRASAVPAGGTLVFWSPFATSAGPDAPPSEIQDAPETYYTMNVRTALRDGLAVRVMFPTVREVVFEKVVAPRAGLTRVALYGPNGNVRLLTPGQVDSLTLLAHAGP